MREKTEKEEDAVKIGFCFVFFFEEFVVEFAVKVAFLFSGVWLVQSSGRFGWGGGRLG